MKVWMRGRLACFTASPARSMSASPARDRPHTTARLTRLAISVTAAKSPSEAIGKPASMMSTPMSSRKSATSSFSSKVMVAPGHCSPSRRVVSKMKTRSVLAVVVCVGSAAVGCWDMGVFLESCRARRGAGVNQFGWLDCTPLSARPGMPERKRLRGR